ncbi:dynamin family protein [Sporosarcina trichiuri]|uniref:dynamin family protein n=1 Tax=Sporosarcina trichiuri TaxID=3056445 RepID=UPI0025B3F3F5|nr:dynamin family protein [Sporosarcina sp. 0.2-SM1T-5]WJY28556.1 dynamin family protein [Sporosarcina sp. 0.2-SM1T-5]
MTSHEEFLHETAALGLLCKEDGDEERYRKAEKLAEKLVKDEYTIAFAGHFSAGKSSMINALTGDDLLPSSPIPTSANIVKVHKADEDFAIVHRQDGSSVKVVGHGFADAVKRMSKEGATISSLEIGHTGSGLPDGISVMDTPGVDSTDDAHRLSTESALHLADIVFYTMDYNHVQSELNFRFTKELMRYNPNVYLIVNQIDKHRDSELSFADFKESVRHSFSLWGVEPKGIFFTSLKTPDLAENDFAAVKKIVSSSIDHRDEQFTATIEGTLAQLKDEHTDYLKQEVTEARENHPEIMESEWAEPHDLEEAVQELSKRISLLGGDAFHIHFEKKRKELLESASLTPYETRELLKEYLESQTSHFKVGVFFSAKKTEEERARRRQALSESLEKLAHTQVEVHLRTLMKQVLKEAGLLTDENSMAIDTMDLTFRFGDIVQELTTPDILTGELILNASGQLRDAILSFYKKKTDAWKLEMAEEAKRQGSGKAAGLQRQLDENEAKLAIIRQAGSKAANLARFESGQMHSWTAEEKAEIGRLIRDWEKQTEPEVLRADEAAAETAAREAEARHKETDEEGPAEERTEDAAPVVRRAEEVAVQVGGIPGFGDTAAYLQSKSERLKQKEFTVALFGAFSAGKSSFSNALLGEAVLPVSPNPTTAAINRIRPVSESNLDGTADIRFKTAEQMTEDVLDAFRLVGLPVTSLEEAYGRADEALAVKLKEESLHIHKSFIRAFRTGYPAHHEQLGQVVTAERDEFVRYVAEESRSCFVESIDFYFDCELTRQGITLVDTPGADSINARHTDVAFEYIRNADAILFITYFNHAFSRADREFLIQLGRVKDAFEMDKMFFVVNAIDLADNEEEADEVKNFVASELTKFGIRNPRVHGISSLQALEAKRDGGAEKKMEEFEGRFYSFLEHDLNALAVQALQEETEKTVQRVDDLIRRTESNRERKAERLADLAEIEQKVQQHYETGFAPVLRHAAHEELKELVFYIHQRVFLRFSDFFKEGYTPSLFVHHSASDALRIALEETAGMTGYDFAQELKVANFRMLTYMKKQIESRQQTERRWLAELDDALSPSLFDAPDAELLTFSAPFRELDRYRHVNRLFKNAKSFFEKGDRTLLQEKLMELLKKDADAYLEEERQRLGVWVDRWLDSTSEQLAVHLQQEAAAQLAAERNLLESHEQLEDWKLIYSKIRQKEMV